MALLFAIIAMLLISWLQLHRVSLSRSLSLPGASDSIRDTGRDHRTVKLLPRRRLWRRSQGLFPLLWLFLWEEEAWVDPESMAQGYVLSVCVCVASLWWTCWKLHFAIAMPGAGPLSRLVSEPGLNGGIILAPGLARQGTWTSSQSSSDKSEIK